MQDENIFMIHEKMDEWQWYEKNEMKKMRWKCSMMYVCDVNCVMNDEWWDDFMVTIRWKIQDEDSKMKYFWLIYCVCMIRLLCDDLFVWMYDKMWNMNNKMIITRYYYEWEDG